jgi:hypothetical protein
MASPSTSQSINISILLSCQAASRFVVSKLKYLHQGDSNLPSPRHLSLLSQLCDELCCTVVLPCVISLKEPMWLVAKPWRIIQISGDSRVIKDGNNLVRQVVQVVQVATDTNRAACAFTRTKLDSRHYNTDLRI